MLPRSFALLSLLLPCSLVFAQEPSRFDIATFTLPEGWTMKVEQGKAVVQTPDHDATVEIGKSTPLTGTIAEFGEALLAEAAKLADYRIEVQGETGTHSRSKGEWHRAVYSFANPDERGKFRYHTVLTVAAGGRCVTFHMLVDSVAAYEAHREELGRMVDGVRLTTTMRLERGKPPLTRFMLDECQDFLEWLLHVPFTAAQRQTVETEVRGYWKQKNQQEIDAMAQLLEARTELARLSEAERDLARQVILDEALEGWRGDKENAAARMMLEIHAAANEPLDAGEPALTRQSLAAFGEFVMFAAGKVAGVEGKFGDDLRDVWVKGIAEDAAGLSKEQRELIASMPTVWAALRVAWPDLDEAAKNGMVDGWRQQPQIAALGKALAEEEKKRRASAAAEGYTDLMTRQAQMNALQSHYRMMQSVMQGQMNTMRIMASNMGGNTTYVYRW